MSPGGSHLAENVLHFTRLLRRAGLRLGPASALDALAATAAVDVIRRDEFYWALHASLIRRPEDHDLFDQAFRLFWRNPTGADAALALLLPQVNVPRGPAPPPLARRLAEAWHRPERPSPPKPSPAEPDREVEMTLTYSAAEQLRTKDFEQMSTAELAAAKRAVAALAVTLRPRPTRRRQAAPRGGQQLDLARTLRDSRRCFGEITTLAWRTRQQRPPPLVVLCDISGSMGRYAEMMMRFLHALSNPANAPQGTGAPPQVFLFGTRLSPVTRFLHRRDPDQALARCGREVLDWSGGTRLRACLHAFNRRWARRTLGQGAVVLLVSDGLDRDPEPGLEAEAARLHRSCRRLIWLNPLLRWSGFEPKARGVAALLPHVDEHRPVHNLASLEELGRALGR